MKYILILCLAITVSSCKFGSNDNENKYERTERKSSKKNKKEAQNGLEELEEALNTLSDGEKVETMPHQELQKMMPNRIGSFEQTDLEGSKQGALGFKISNAHAEYKDGNKKIEIDIVDSGSLGPAALGVMNWLDLEIDKSSKNGFEKTGTIKGHKSFEKFEKNGWSELLLFVNDRYLVTARGNVEDFDDLKDAVLDLPLKKLK